jgi:hypothetical protein
VLVMNGDGPSLLTRADEFQRTRRVRFFGLCKVGLGHSIIRTQLARDVYYSDLTEQ